MMEFQECGRWTEVELMIFVDLLLALIHLATKMSSRQPDFTV